MAERDRKLDALLADFVATTPEPRDEVSERARRRRLSAVIDERIAQSPGSKPRFLRDGLRRHAVPLSAAAGVLLVLATSRFFGRVPIPPPERELLGAVPSEPSAAPAPSNPPERREPRAPQAPPPLRERFGAARAAPASSSSQPAASDTTPSTSASSAIEPTAAPLAAQNELFQSAVRSQRRGDDESALAGFDALLVRYPESPLAADARVRKFRTLTRLGRSDEARAAASEYLARHPAGFARPEAEQLLRGEAMGNGVSEP
jgi:hypothetical protein